MSQILTVPSSEAVAITLPSVDIAMSVIGPVWPSSKSTQSPISCKARQDEDIQTSYSKVTPSSAKRDQGEP